MPEFAYDLHIHSCLSPCGDEDMTPANIDGMAALKGLDVIALTDHNSCKNCPAIMKAAQEYGISVIPGMELTTMEEVHVLCLFPELSRAMDFDAYVYERLLPFPNREDLFGRQIYMDDMDGILGEESRLLAGCADISVDHVCALVSSFGGLAYPAHIDRPSFSLIATLGFWNPDLGFPLAELSRHCPPGFLQRPDLHGLRFITGSDAHYLEDISAAPRALGEGSCLQRLIRGL